MQVHRKKETQKEADLNGCVSLTNTNITLIQKIILASYELLLFTYPPCFSQSLIL